MKTPAWLTDGRAALALVSLTIGVGIGTYATPLIFQPAIPKEVRDFSNKYHFINPLLACNTDQNIGNAQANELKNQIVNSIKAHEDAGDVTDASVYFRDLNDGPGVSINTSTAFSPGSLLKVPLAMSVYKKAESDPSFLQEQLDYTGKETSDQQYFAATQLPVGKYSVERLVSEMLINSNNNTANILATAVGPDDFLNTYEQLGISIPPTAGTDYTTNTHDYVSFFRVLYNATYLDEIDSEKVLQIMSQSTFRDGLVAGVPRTIVVSHKFGERSYSDSNTLQLHDCGIIYAPNHPYLLCVMTRGTNYSDMAKTIAGISSLAYNYVE